MTVCCVGSHQCKRSVHLQPATCSLPTVDPNTTTARPPHERGTSSCFSLFLAAGALLGTRPDQGASEGGPFMTACDLDAQSRDPSRGCAGASHWLPDGAATTLMASVLLQQACMFPAGTPVKQLAIVCDMAAQLLLGKHACTRTPPKVMAGGSLTLCSTTYWRYARLPMSTPDSPSQPSCDLVSHHMALSLHHLLLPGLVLGLGLGGSIPLWCRQPPGYSLPCVALILSDSPSQHRSKLDPAQTTCIVCWLSTTVGSPKTKPGDDDRVALLSVDSDPSKHPS